MNPCEEAEAAEADHQQQQEEEELLDVITETGEKTGISKPRGLVHQNGLYHRAVHVWIFAESTQELLLQRRADSKDSWAGLWDVSSAGHISAGDKSLLTARRELLEELGVNLPKDAFELIFVFLQECAINDGKYINNEFNDVYLVTTPVPIPLEAFTLQETEVSAVKYIFWEDYKHLLEKEDENYVPYNVQGQYGQLFSIIEKRYKKNKEACSRTLEKKISRYAPIHLDAELTALSEADKEALFLLVKAAMIIDDIFYTQVWYSNPALRDWLKGRSHISNLDRLKWLYYSINKSPWSCLDENEAFLTTADSAVMLCAEATRPVAGWKGLEYKAAFPSIKPAGANFYPPDMDKMEFEMWKNSLSEDQQRAATGYFNVIHRHSESEMDICTAAGTDHVVTTNSSNQHDLYMVPFSQEYRPFLTKAAELLQKAGELSDSPSLKRLLKTKAEAFLSNDYYDSDIAWMELEFEMWKNSLSEDQQRAATGYFNVIHRHSESGMDICTAASTDHVVTTNSSNQHDLYMVPFSQEYRPFLTKAAELLQKAGELSDSPSLKRLLKTKAEAFLSNDYYDSDIAWMELDSKLDVTIGPYETYEDALFGYKATFEAFIGIRDDMATSQVKLFGDHLQVLEKNLPLDDMYKSKDVVAAPIRVIRLVYNAGDVKGPQTVAFNLPNDERIVSERGTSMVMLKNVSEAKFKHILQPIADVCIKEEEKKHVDFDSFFTHTICHECCHGIGPHSITLPNGRKSTVRLELQEVHSALEEAKADIVGLWALKFLINQELLPKSLEKSMYVSFLAGCFRSIRFGLEEAHGKGQALQFNWLFENGAFVLHSDETFFVDFTKVEGAVDSLSREILTIQAKGDKAAAKLLLQEYGKMTSPLCVAMEKLEKVQVPVDIAPVFGTIDKLLNKNH
eukprot:TRINITY_DN643_c0_g3_i1.p1 TRINITY_DN643_c0_g3~~TRINITY_DN643_c0_g3_i1.p1  ORF type:complete len:926 (+),score=205.34 TRINITY_DN643_c0_g3_i1:55-2778(+)